MQKNKVLLLMSGGIDSTACLFYYRERMFEVTSVFVDYGHKANKTELRHLRLISENLNFPIQLLNFKGATIPDIWEVKGRNAFMILAALMSNPTFEGLLSMGINKGTQYYDCGSRFLKDMQAVLDGYTKGAVQLDFPFLDLYKQDIVNYCMNHKIPIDLTYSCQVGAEIPCGYCPSCKDRDAILAQIRNDVEEVT